LPSLCALFQTFALAGGSARSPGAGGADEDAAEAGSRDLSGDAGGVASGWDGTDGDAEVVAP